MYGGNIIYYYVHMNIPELRTFPQIEFLCMYQKLSKHVQLYLPFMIPLIQLPEFGMAGL